MKKNPLQSIISFIIKYIWIFCVVLIALELISTLYSAMVLLRQTSQSILASQNGVVSGRVDGVLRLLNGFANDEVIGDTSLPIYDRAILTRSYQDSYDLYMIAVLDKDFNVVSADEKEPPSEPFSLASRDYLQRMKKTGKYQITDAMLAGADGVTKNYTISVPLFQNGEINGGIFGSIYFDDIESLLGKDSHGNFLLFGRENTVMTGDSNLFYGKTLPELLQNSLCFGTTAEQLDTAMTQGESGDYWVLDASGLSYVTYSQVKPTEWTLLYQSSLISVLPLIIPILLAKVFCYILLCYLISKFGRRYLQTQLSSVTHLMERVTAMQKELFRTEQDSYDSLLELTQQGLTDQLTGLVTRSVLVQRFSSFLENKSQKGMLCFLDLDDLKRINDSFGHEVGDLALHHFGKILKIYEEKYHGIAARYGGDEFILVLNGLEPDEGEAIAKNLCKDLAVTVPSSIQPVPIHGSIGVAFYPDHGSTLEELLSKSDLALYVSKHNGKGQYSIYDNRN